MINHDYHGAPEDSSPALLAKCGSSLAEKDAGALRARTFCGPSGSSTVQETPTAGLQMCVAASDQLPDKVNPASASTTVVRRLLRCRGLLFGDDRPAKLKQLAHIHLETLLVTFVGCSFFHLTSFGRNLVQAVEGCTSL
jgi:hypothetical protein